MEEETMVELQETLEKLCSAAAILQTAAERFQECEQHLAAAAQETVGRITATVESEREAELERKLAAAETKIAELTAAATSLNGRKTVATMFAKSAGEGFEAKAMDVALASLTVEQRIAVKSELMRAGLVG